VALQNTCRTELAMARIRSEEPLRLADAGSGQAGEAAA
jgi:hypothetical protein